jgi:hypothetical protein
MNDKKDIHSLFRIFEDFGKLIGKKTNIDEKLFLKKIAQFLKFSNKKTLLNIIQYLNQNIKNTKLFLDSIHDLLPMLHYVLPDIKIFRDLGKEYKFNYRLLYYIPLNVYSTQGNKIYKIYDFPFNHKIAFDTYFKYDRPSTKDSSFIFLLENIIFRHLNITPNFNSVIINIFENFIFKEKLFCFVYPNKFWERVDEYFELLNKKGDIKHYLAKHYNFIQGFLHILQYFYKNPFLFNILKKNFFFIYLSKNKLFKNFKDVIRAFKNTFNEIGLIYPLRMQFYNFLRYIEKLDIELQNKFLCKIFFYEQCPICFSYIYLDRFSFHITKNFKNSTFKYINKYVPENYYCFHFISCRNCFNEWVASKKYIRDIKELKLECSECHKPVMIPQQYVTDKRDIYEYVKSKILTFGFHNENTNFIYRIMLTSCPILTLKHNLKKSIEHADDQIMDSRNPLFISNYEEMRLYLYNFMKYYDEFDCSNCRNYVLELDTNPIQISQYYDPLPAFINSFNKKHKNKIYKKRLRVLENKLQTIENNEYDNNETIKLKRKIIKNIENQKKKLAELNPPNSWYSKFVPKINWFTTKNINASFKEYEYDPIDESID